MLKQVQHDGSCHHEQADCHPDLGSGSPETGKQLLDRIIEERNKKLLAEWKESLKKKPKAKKPDIVAADEQINSLLVKIC